MIKKLIIIGIVTLISVIPISAWYQSYAYRQNITNPATFNNSFSINGTTGFLGKFIWVNATSVKSIYYYNSSNYTVTDSSDNVIPFDTVGTGGLTYTPTYVYPAKALGVYHLSINSTSQYDSVNKHNGTCINTPNFTNSGKFGSAYLFNSSTYINLTSADFEMQNFTVSVWVKPRSAKTQTPLAIQLQTNTNQAGIWLYMNTTAFILYYYTGTNVLNTLNGGNYVADTWYNVVFRKINANMTWFINGVYNGSKNSTSAVIDYTVTTTKRTQIGSGWDSTTAYLPMNGTVDELVILNNTYLTNNQIIEIYNNSLTVGAGSMTLNTIENRPNCVCAGINTNWAVNLSNSCNITTNCDLGTGTLSFVGTSGYANCSATVNTTNLGDPINGTLWINNNCDIRVKT